MDLLDSFEHQSPEGIHECFVFNVTGPCVRSYYLLGLEYDTDPTESPSSQSPKDVEINISTAKRMLLQIVQGLDFLHKRGIVHSDLHLGNLLMSIEDLGSLGEDKLARHDERTTHALQGSDSSCEDSESTNGNVEPCTASDMDLPEAKRQKTCRAAGQIYRARKGRPASVAEWPREPYKPALTSMDNFRPGVLSLPPPFLGMVEYLSPMTIKISDMGGAFFLSDPPDHPLTPTDIQSPEMILGRPIRESHDIWAFGCLVFELITGRALFSRPCESDPSEDENSEVGSEQIRESGDAEDDRVRNKGSNNDHGQTGCCQEATTGEDKNEDVDPTTQRVPSPKTSLLQQFASKLGPISPSPLSDWPHHSQFFTEGGKIKVRNGFTSWPSLEDHFHESPTLVDVSPAEQVALLDFIRYILRYDPEKRPSAEELLQHPWFLEESGETSDSGNI